MNYNGFVASRAAYLDIPVNLDIIVHEILRSFYSKNVSNAEKNYLDSIDIKVNMSSEDIFFVTTLNNCALQIESVANKLAQNIINHVYEDVNKKEIEKVFTAAINKDEDDDTIAVSVSNIILAIKTKYSDAKCGDAFGKYRIHDSVEFYLHIPNNIKVM